MDRIIATAQLTGGLMNTSLPVLPGEALGFAGGTAKIHDHYDPKTNDHMMVTVLMDPRLIVSPNGPWDGWFDHWIELCKVKGGPKADVRRVVPAGVPMNASEPERGFRIGRAYHKLGCTCNFCNRLRKKGEAQAVADQATKDAADPSIAWALPAKLEEVGAV